MAPADARLARQNAALKLRAHGVALDVSQGRVRLRATMPPPPSVPPGTAPKQQRISTSLSDPDQATEALQLAELLGSALERHRLGIERLSTRWQWPVAVAATYGCRPPG